ncbi:hypothetical protein F4802DRAFT_597256 [Xylaria palmicola]|nr:hypothetical protein F4802DRAFT_597256 [Xylaria palmicola]
MSLALTKEAILLLYLRIFSGVKWFKRTCYTLFGCIAAYCFAVILVTIFQCTPIVSAFDKTVTSSNCIQFVPFWYINAAVSIATDLIILVIPMPLIYSLQVQWMQKVALVCVFALGFFAISTTILRIVTMNFKVTNRDPLYDVRSITWTLIEMGVALTCACLPQIRLLFLKIVPKIRSIYSGSKESPSVATSQGSRRRTNDEEDGIWANIDGRKGHELTTLCKASIRSNKPMTGKQVMVTREFRVTVNSTVGPPSDS